MLKKVREEWEVPYIRGGQDEQRAAGSTENHLRGVTLEVNLEEGARWRKHLSVSSVLGNKEAFSPWDLVLLMCKIIRVKG